MKRKISANKEKENKYGKSYEIGSMFVNQYKKRGYLNVSKIKLTLMKNDDNNSYVFQDPSTGMKMYVIMEVQGNTYFYKPMQVGKPDSFIGLNPLNVDEFESEYDPVESNFSVIYKNGKLTSSSY